MSRHDDLYLLPADLPAPVDDGACDRLPTFEAAGMRLLNRLTLIISAGLIEHVFYPVFPPDRNASDVLAWLEAASGR